MRISFLCFSLGTNKNPRISRDNRLFLRLRYLLQNSRFYDKNWRYRIFRGRHEEKCLLQLNIARRIVEPFILKIVPPFFQSIPVQIFILFDFVDLPAWKKTLKKNLNSILAWKNVLHLKVKFSELLFEKLNCLCKNNKLDKNLNRVDYLCNTSGVEKKCFLYVLGIELIKFCIGIHRAPQGLDLFRDQTRNLIYFNLYLEGRP